MSGGENWRMVPLGDTTAEMIQQGSGHGCTNRITDSEDTGKQNGQDLYSGGLTWWLRVGTIISEEYWSVVL